MSDAMSDSMKPTFWEETLKYKCFKNDIELQNLLLKLQDDGNLQNKVNVMDRMNILPGVDQHYSYMFIEFWRGPENWELFDLIDLNFIRDKFSIIPFYSSIFIISINQSF